MEGAYEEAPAEGITGLPVQEGEEATGLEAAPPHEPEVEGHGVPAEGEPPVEEAPPASIWERKRISDLRTTMLHRNMDVSLLDSFLATVGDPLTKTGRSSKSEPRKRSVAGGGPPLGEAGEGEGITSPDGIAVVPEKRRRTTVAPDPNLPPEVQSMTVGELRVRAQFPPWVLPCLLHNHGCDATRPPSPCRRSTKSFTK